MSAERFLRLVYFSRGDTVIEHPSSQKWTAKFSGGVRGFASTTVEIEVNATRKDDLGKYVEVPAPEALATAQRLAAEFFLAVAYAGRDWMGEEHREKLTAAFPPRDLKETTPSEPNG